MITVSLDSRTLCDMRKYLSTCQGMNPVCKKRRHPSPAAVSVTLSPSASYFGNPSPDHHLTLEEFPLNLKCVMGVQETFCGFYWLVMSVLALAVLLYLAVCLVALRGLSGKSFHWSL